MQIHISGQHLSIGQSLQEYTDKRLKEVVNKYFAHAVSANIHFIKQSYFYLCDLTVNVGVQHHNFIKTDGQCDDIYASFDQALTKIEKKLRRYKSRLVDHNKAKISTIPVSEAVNYTINTYEILEGEGNNNPPIIAEKPVSIMPMDVLEAIMKMDLENLPALMFKNVHTNRMNTVYYRRDGNIAWVDSKE